MPAQIQVFPTTALGDTTYLLTVGRDAALLDPQRDVWRFLAAAESRGLTVRYVLETHVHNDYLSGALEVRSATGAQVVAPARGAYRFPHRGMAEGDEIALGDVVLQAMETPGHTPEHLAYIVSEAGRPVAVFTGGSLLLGSAGRTDLLGEGSTEQLTRAQFHSLRRLADLPDQTRVLPTHGAGSFCAATAPSQQPPSTIGQQRQHNSAMLAPDEDSFVRQQLRGLLRYPSYYRHMAPANRVGPTVLGRLPELRARTAADVDRLTSSGAWVVDARDRWSFASAHVPGSINVELDDMFASFVGWVVPFGAPVVLVVAEPVDLLGQQALTQLLRIGYERVEGYLAGGIRAWVSAGRTAMSYPVADVNDLRRASATGAHPLILDVRQPSEWGQGMIPGSLQLFVGDLPGRVNELPTDREIWTICRSGYRAAIAASLLDRAGRHVRLVAHAGVERWLALSAARGEVHHAGRRCGCRSAASPAARRQGAASRDGQRAAVERRDAHRCLQQELTPNESFFV
jgi:glyoxylase-like metal-dependent hydrolase (beta-lactamase superfamily II)/rhodanese-related sulfurtransferase